VSLNLSLSDELWMLFKSLDGARMLAEEATESADVGDVAHTLVAVLGVVTERLRLLDRVVRGTVDPRVLLCSQNQRESPEANADDENADIFLPTWSDEELLRHHRAAVRRAKRRIAHEEDKRNSGMPLASGEGESK